MGNNLRLGVTGFEKEVEKGVAFFKDHHTLQLQPCCR